MTKTSIYRVSYTVVIDLSAESPEQALAMAQNGGDIFDSTTENWAVRPAAEPGEQHSPKSFAEGYINAADHLLIKGEAEVYRQARVYRDEKTAVKSGTAPKVAIPLCGVCSARIATAQNALELNAPKNPADFPGGPLEYPESFDPS